MAEFYGRMTAEAMRPQEISASDCASDQNAQTFFSGNLVNAGEIQLELRVSPQTTMAACLLRFKILRQSAARLNGSFVWLALDHARQTLLLARDQLGRHALFYALADDGDFCYADTLPRLLRLLRRRPPLNQVAVSGYFRLGYIAPPLTVYQGVHKLEPGQLLSWNGRGEPTLEYYWQPHFLPKLRLSFDEAVSETDRLLNRAVQRCLSSDRRCGALLSGGIDSGLVTALAVQASECGFGPAISIAFADKLYDESPLAALSAAKLRIQHVVRQVKAAEIDCIPALQQLSGEPFADSSLLATHLALKEASKHCSAVFTGDGGDEFFCGYRRLQFMAWRQLGAGIPARLAGFGARMLVGLLPQGEDRRSVKANLARAMAALALPEMTAYTRFQEIFSPTDVNDLLSDLPPAVCEAQWQQALQRIDATDLVERYDGLEILTYLSGDGFRKCEVAGIGVPVAQLSPLLDLELAEFALRLPRSYKLTLRERKRPLRALARQQLPSELLRQTKRGFGIPITAWFRHELAPQAQELAATVSEWDQEGWLNATAVRRLVAEHITGAQDHGAKLWTLLCYQAWRRSLA